MYRVINLGTGRWSGFDISQAKVLENLFDHILILYDADYPHLTETFRTSQWVYLPGSGPGQAAIF